jgi:hypothetical protein
MTVPQNALTFTFQLGNGSFGNSGFSTVTVSNVRATAKITQAGTPEGNTAEIKIFGLTGSVLKSLSRIGLQPDAVRNNVVTINAGQVGGQMSLAFAGGIWESWPDYQASPDVSLNVIAKTALLAQMKPVAPSSYPGAADVATMMQNLATQMGYTFENNGVSVKLSNQYLAGTARMQALAAAKAANIYVIFENEGTMAILPKSGSRSGATPVLDPTQGTLVGYPAYISPAKVALKTPYNPQLKMMGNVQVQNSIVSGANATWRINRLHHDLASQMPDGPWFSEILGGLLFGGTSE